MSIEGQGHYFTIYFPSFVSYVIYNATISGERLQDHWSSVFCWHGHFSYLLDSRKEQISVESLVENQKSRLVFI